MAVTKIWAIKDSLARVVDYAKNPNKTVLSDLEQVLLYAENDKKTITGDEKTMFVTGVNCNRETAIEEMIRIQKRFDKCTGNVAYHAYQSFKTGEVTPQLAHKIGVELAQKMFPEHQVVVATHFNTGTYHNHFVINSVNMFTGKKFNCNKGAYYRFRAISDELCAENNLTVIKNPKGMTPRNIYFAEKRGEPTKYNLMRKAIDETMEMCINYAQFKKIMFKKGYIINDEYSRKYPTIRSIHDKKAVRMYQLEDNYLPKNIVRKVENNPYYFQNRYLDFMKSKKRRKYKTYKYKGNFSKVKKITGLEVLFLILFHLLGLRRINENTPTNVRKPISPEMQREIRKFRRYAREITLITTENLKTGDDVKAFISKTESKIVDIAYIRQKYRNKLRNCTDEKLISKYKFERDVCTTKIKDYREDIKTAYQILEDNQKIKEVISIEKQARNKERNATKNRNRGVR